MGMLVAGGGEMTAQQAIGAMLTISSIPIALYGMMVFVMFKEVEHWGKTNPQPKEVG